MSASLGVFLLGIGSLHHSPSVVHRICRRSHCVHFIRCVLDNQLPSNLIPLMSLQDTTVTVHLPSLYLYCEQSPLFFNRIIPPIFIIHSPPASTEPAVHALKDAEIVAVKHYANETDVHSLSWLHSCHPPKCSAHCRTVDKCSTTEVCGTIKPPNSWPLDTCRSALHELLQRPDTDLGPEGQIDRFSRAFARLPIRDLGFGFSSGLLGSMKNFMSPEVHLQLQCFSIADRTLSYRNEIRQQFLPWSWLTLQPIMWARLLHEFLSIHLEEEKNDIYDHLIKDFFPSIPQLYWEADFVCPPPVFEYQEIKVFNNKVSGEAVTLEHAVEKYLYPWVADITPKPIECHRQYL